MSLIAAIPDHWEVAPLRRHIQRNDGGVWGDEPDGLGDVVVLRSTEQTVAGEWDITDPAVRKLNAHDVGAARLMEGDLLITKSSGSSLHIGKTTIVSKQLAQTGCCFSNFMQRIRLDSSLIPKLVWYILNNDLARLQLDRLSNSTTGLANLSARIIGQITIPVTTWIEQQAIVSFLDREVAKIDALIAEQQRLIELLKEKRQAVISHAVTKGLNPDAPMKPSGVEWIGDVPIHWQVMTLERITMSRCDGPFGSGLKSEHYTEAGVRVVRLQNIRVDGFASAAAAYIDPSYYETQLRDHDVRGGDVLIAGLGDDKHTVGRACVAPDGIEPAMVKADCFRFRLNGEQACSKFVAIQLSAGAAADAGLLASGSTRSRIPLSTMSTRRLALPPISEQKEITSCLREQISAFHELIGEAEHAIVLLQERRTVLISAAVTGKVDVRNYAPAEAA